ncbi:TrbI F-type domain-containing protein [Gilliamella sp. BG7]|uniref:TrbI F-type domain-containing protein n=1 Tax=unclassified Gilliamella TaxID=2685620 RepID=UPI003986B716
MDNRKTITLTLVASIFFVNLLLTIYLCLFKDDKPKMVSFDMKETVNLFLSQVNSGNFDEDQINNITQIFNTALDDSIKSYSHSHNVLILVKPAVVYGIDDVTEDIQQLISEKMVN